ncbi:MAG: TadE family protein [Verrucomicrobiota bacterium]
MNQVKQSQFVAHESVRKTRRGQSLVEFCLVIPLFFLAVFGVIDIGWAMFTQMTLQHSLREAGRFAVTGRHLTDPNNPNLILSRVNSIRLIAQNSAAGLNVVNLVISSANGGSGSAGGPLDVVTVALTTDLKLFTPLIGKFFGTNGVYRFTVNTTFRNEPFDPSQTN